MGSTSSKAKRPTPVEAEAVVVPRIPQEIIDEILGYLAADSDHRSLRSCALVAKSWVPSCQRHLFHTVHFTPGATFRWSMAFQAPEESPSLYIKDLHVLTGGSDYLFFKYTPWFTNMESLRLLGDGRWTPTCWRLPQSITSLTMRTDTCDLVQVRDVMAQLQNLDDLSLSGVLILVDEAMLVGIGTSLKGRFGGRLQLLKEYAGHDAVNMLLEIPTGLRYTEVKTRGVHGDLLSTVRLAEACCKTLVKLSYDASFDYESEANDQSFDFSKFPNLQEVEFEVDWMNGRITWIPMALSTIKPTTSPCLSVIKLSFVRSAISNRSVGALVKDAGDDLRWVASEAARIESEFEGEVNFTVLRDSSFQMASGALGVRSFDVETAEMEPVDTLQQPPIPYLQYFPDLNTMVLDVHITEQLGCGGSPTPSVQISIP